MEPLPEGFMCDLPYYKYAKGYIVQLNPEYRCRVVRLIFHRYRMPCSESKVQIFSSETGEWRESVVSSLQDIRPNSIDCDGCYAIASNRMLYWMSYGEFLLSFDPFLINNSVRTSRKDGDEDITGPSYKMSSD
ncbi:hypothetical protein D8674_036164 [Pyrus ussuriensis x Pyrus communis]|uniref:F-box protein n=1 Tax=Pyrus ussuriensis x Pyrus communis TaxID=2448454 RepID=A0A5N5GEW9_9ROSA|nr:hypothetical protein D8674_036164 [Pyrus ussuriensis x Pyrus communis]